MLVVLQLRTLQAEKQLESTGECMPRICRPEVQCQCLVSGVVCLVWKHRVALRVCCWHIQINLLQVLVFAAALSEQQQQKCGQWARAITAAGVQFTLKGLGGALDLPENDT